jgi:hypothetical protein
MARIVSTRDFVESRQVCRMSRWEKLLVIWIGIDGESLRALP